MPQINNYSCLCLQSTNTLDRYTAETKEQTEKNIFPLTESDFFKTGFVTLGVTLPYIHTAAELFTVKVKDAAWSNLLTTFVTET